MEIECRALGGTLLLEPIPPALIDLFIFEMWSHFFSRPAWTVIHLLMFPSVAGMTGTYQHAHFFSIESGSHELFTWAGLET
jgi:hypothetical protein